MVFSEDSPADDACSVSMEDQSMTVAFAELRGSRLGGLGLGSWREVFVVGWVSFNLFGDIMILDIPNLCTCDTGTIKVHTYHTRSSI